jgi:hypothetical protein
VSGEQQDHTVPSGLLSWHTVCPPC